jgi:hypothetical protein
MRKSKLELETLDVDSFIASEAATPSFMMADSVIINTVLGPTEGLSCGGTCGTCGGTDCWA